MKNINDEIKKENIKLHNQGANNFDNYPSYVFKNVDKLFDKIINDITTISKTTGVALDCGCGTGIMATKLVKYGFDVDLVDISEEMINVTKKKLKYMEKDYNFYASYYISDIEDYFKKNKKKYDVICFTAVLHHIKDYLKILDIASKRLKKDGYIIIVDEPSLKKKERKKICKFLDYIEGNYINLYRAIKNPMHAIKFLIRQHKDKINVDLAEYHSKTGINHYKIADIFNNNNVMLIEYKTYIMHVAYIFELFNFLYKDESTTFYMKARKIV